ncbi:hypothetical protein BJL95_02455 [Methylomonas sp. LWB]|uniref:CFI-box-CTERM domain-containing protein n=1 Tax=Methylomonas sp. LWB TaxID=1905845 RepID=UPI0008DA2871|nr:CFI-box-CTERM domain-containing protein [Methylomonas sp. LWB]OHX37404.1 hypothetical protein BJL95_02455 [Methylomonas sp. LWB]
MRIIYTSNLVAQQGVYIDQLPTINSFPVLDLSPTAWPRHEKKMMELKKREESDDVWMGSPDTSGRALWTCWATGGCVPVAAAEVDPGFPRKVRWISLTHCTGGNLPSTLTQGATNWARVYVIFVVNSGSHSGHNVEMHVEAYIDALPGKDQIPPNNIFVVYGPHASLAISPTGLVGVLPDDQPPTALAQQNGSSCCKCYIATATCLALGLPDDCEELKTLRWFRDNVLLKTVDGTQDVEAYYRDAPSIVAEIDRRTNSSDIYLGIFRQVVQPAVEAIRHQDYEGANAIFKRILGEHCHRRGSHFGSTESMADTLAARDHI